MATQPHARTIGTDLGELPLVMIRAIKAMVADVDARKDAAGLSGSRGLTAMHGIAARYLDEHDDVTIVELAAHLRVTKQSASEIVSALERAGYVVRHPHPVDGRARWCELTPDGAAGLVRSRALWTAMVADWEALVDPDDLAATARVLHAYLDAHPTDG